MEANFFQEIKFFNIKSENPCFIAASSALKDLVSITDQLAFSKSPVLITGEKGSGKESFALQMGLKGVEQGKKFFIVDCRKYSNLNEFDTDFSDKKIIFFKEIGFLDENAQNKLLHLIQKINENRRYSKIIASSSDNLENFVSENRFNKELFQCFNNLSIKIPSLRSRKK